MNKDDQNSKHAVDERYGVKVYQSNPSIPSETEIKRSKRAQIGTDMRGLVVDGGSGEILGHGGAIAYEWEEVDKERFVKLYLAGLKQAAGLSKAGLAVFETVYKQVRALRATSSSGLRYRIRPSPSFLCSTDRTGLRFTLSLRRASWYALLRTVLYRFFVAGLHSP
jgi:hypothetical protein